jgi:hypothetical protein
MARRAHSSRVHDLLRAAVVGIIVAVVHFVLSVLVLMRGFGKLVGDYSDSAFDYVCLALLAVLWWPGYLGRAVSGYPPTDYLKGDLYVWTFSAVFWILIVVAMYLWRRRRTRVATSAI